MTWGTATASWSGSSYTCPASSGSFVGTGDFNGDGTTDVFCRGNTVGKVFIGVSNGSSFAYGIFDDFGCSSTGERLGGADFDGDGQDDFYCIASNGTATIRLSTGSAFTTNSFTGLDNAFCAWDNLVLGDLNGDGRLDAACPANGKVALSTGLGLLSMGSFGGFCLGSNRVLAADVDGDGAAELVCDNQGSPANDTEVREWTGTALSAAETWKGDWCGNSIFLSGDFNGDGKADLLCGHNRFAVSGTTAVMPDLMTSAENGMGGETTASYTRSNTFANVNNPGVKYVVTALTTTDGRGGSSTRTYFYEGGKVDRKERQFLGFSRVRETAPCIDGESACPYTDTWLSQDLAAVGAPLIVQRADGSNNVLSAVASAYTTNNATLPRTSRLDAVESTTYESPGVFKRTRWDFAYDSYGNRTQEVFSGDDSTSGDELQTDSTFVPNPSAYIVNRLARIERRAPGGSSLASQEYLYDGAPSYTSAPVAGKVTKVRSWLDPGSRWVEKAIAYDGWGNLTGVTDETARTVTTSYDSTDHLFPTVVANAAGETQSMTWDTLCGVPTQATDPNNQSTTYQYDPLCRPTRTDTPLGGYAVTSYLDLGNPDLQRTRVETPPPTGSSGGNLWSEDLFDGLGRVYRSQRRGPTAGESIVVERTFTARGSVAGETAPFYESESADPTTFTYDAHDRVVSIQHPDLAEAERSYGLWSDTAVDENGKAVTRRYDAYGRVVEVERTHDGQPVVTTSAYDPLGRLVHMTDALGNEWSWTFDTLGRTLSRSDPDAGIWSYAYDDAGRLSSQIDAKSQSTTFTYDSVGRVATKVSPLGTVTFARSQAASGFFNVGLITTITSPSTPATTLRTDHDALGRPVKIKRNFEGVDYVVERRYDQSGSLTGITYPDADTVGSVGNPLLYDDAGRLRSVPGLVSTIAYDAAGRPTSRQNANGTQTNHTYDTARGFLESIVTSGPSSVQSLSYLHDSAGLVTQVTSPITNEAWSYAYDDLYRVTQATNLNNSVETQSFQYDEIGRIIYNSKVGNYTYPAAGTPRPHAPSNVNGGSYAYDSNGNLTSGGGRTPVWDAENRITQVGTAQFTYDGFGERLKKTAAGVTSLYPVGDDYEITGGTITKYVSVEGLGLLAKRVASTTYWLHTDRLGSIQAITDSAGAIVQRRTYRPYGAKIADSSSHVESRGWIDQRQDAETGLTYLHARYYDPTLGTFVSPDPLHPAEPGVGTNRYAYAFGDPANGTDRSGLDCYVTYGGWTRGPLGNVTATAPSTVSVPGNCTTSASGMMALASRMGDAADSAYERQQARAAAMRQQAAERHQTTGETSTGTDQGSGTDSGGCKRNCGGGNDAVTTATTPAPTPIVPAKTQGLGATAFKALLSNVAGDLFAWGAGKMTCGSGRQAMHGAAALAYTVGGVEGAGYAIGGGLAAFGSVPVIGQGAGLVAIGGGVVLARQGLVQANAQYLEATRQAGHCAP